jgi:pyruvate dehydrogenase (quinone)
LLTVGSNFPYSQFLPEFGQARGVQIDRSGSWIGMRYPYEVNLVGDAKATLRALIPLLERKADRSWREQIESDVERWETISTRRAMTDAEPINPMRMFHELSERMPPNAIISSDSGTAANWYARHLRFGPDVRGSLSGTLATMGAAVPYAIGAKWAHPDRPAIALVGDGAMQMNNMAELITIARYWRQWQDPRLIVAVLHNDDLNQVTWELRAMGGHPKFEESQDVPDIDYAAFARSVGLKGINVDTAAQVGPAWDSALAATMPVLLDVRCDPTVPIIPPHTSWEQAKDLASSLLHGDEDRVDVAVNAVKQKVQEFLPGRKDES